MKKGVAARLSSQDQENTAMTFDPQRLLRDLFATAIAAAHPRQVLADHLPADRSGRVIVIGAGKAAAAMAEVIEQEWQGEVSGLVVTRYEHGAECKKIEVVEAAHPVPDDAGERVARRVLELVSNLSEDDRVIFLLSGGGSSLLALPAAGISLTDKQAINKALLKSGATIGEMNCVRKHLSAIKGGRLAKACWPATVYTYAISDVPGDEATVIASGPTVGDPTTSAEAPRSLASARTLAMTCSTRAGARISALSFLNRAACATKPPRLAMSSTMARSISSIRWRTSSRELHCTSI